MGLKTGFSVSRCCIGPFHDKKPTLGIVTDHT